jgi:hypothetical protein
MDLNTIIIAGIGLLIAKYALDGEEEKPKRQYKPIQKKEVVKPVEEPKQELKPEEEKKSETNV